MYILGKHSTNWVTATDPDFFKMKFVFVTRANLNFMILLPQPPVVGLQVCTIMPGLHLSLSMSVVCCSQPWMLEDAES